MGKEKTAGEKDGFLQNGTQTEAERQQEKVGFVQPEGGWGWVVCFTSMCSNGTVFGSINTFGILFVAMLDQFGGDDIGFKISWVGSVCTGLTFLFCMVASIMSDRFGIRKVAFIGGALAFIGMLSSAFVENLMLYYLTYGVLMGTGFAFVYSPSLVILGHYFKRRMGLVNGLVTFGSAVFTITYALVLPILLEKVGLKYSLLCLSGLIFMLMPYSLTWKPLVRRESNLGALMMSKESVVEHVNDCCRWTREFLNVSIWRNRGYVIWAVANGVSLLGYFVPFTHLVQHTKDNFPDSNGNLLPMFISISSGVSRILFGLLADFQCVSRIHMQQAAFFLLGVTTLCIPFAESFTSLIIICLVMGLCDGLFICLLGPIAFDLVGERGASQAIGFLFGIFSVPMTLGPPLAGLIYDHLHSYRVAFHAAGAPPIIGALLLFLIPRHKERHPAVSEVEEFVAVSCPDIYNSRVLSSSDMKGSMGAVNMTENGGPSRTELIVVSDRDVYDKLRAEGALPEHGDKGEDEVLAEEEEVDTAEENSCLVLNMDVHNEDHKATGDSMASQPTAKEEEGEKGKAEEEEEKKEEEKVEDEIDEERQRLCQLGEKQTV
ncbi:monocarboxylate transporter 10-like [Babylonia areolata]|uniref:monocarboxylate transporter 10-like n=1 Tax=Babylonia areolata TaxID=304850 RepID=UPI003FCF0AD2